MFIFDGLFQKYCNVFDEIIGRKAAKRPYVVKTFQPDQRSEEEIAYFNNTITIQMYGYSDEGVELRLRDCPLSPAAEFETKNVLKVPLFNTMFGALPKELCQFCFNSSAVVETFVKFLCNRYRTVHPDFTEDRENDVLMILGQVAQYSIICRS